MYYACVMQGTASISEDARQPPYLCPVDLAKISRATGADEVQRYQQLLAFCDRHEGDMFSALGAWIRGVLRKTRERRDEVLEVSTAVREWGRNLASGVSERTAIVID